MNIKDTSKTAGRDKGWYIEINRARLKIQGESVGYAAVVTNSEPAANSLAHIKAPSATTEYFMHLALNSLPTDPSDATTLSRTANQTIASTCFSRTKECKHSMYINFNHM